MLMQSARQASRVGAVVGPAAMYLFLFLLPLYRALLAATIFPGEVSVGEALCLAILTHIPLLVIWGARGLNGYMPWVLAALYLVLLSGWTILVEWRILSGLPVRLPFILDSTRDSFLTFLNLLSDTWYLVVAWVAAQGLALWILARSFARRTFAGGVYVLLVLLLGGTALIGARRIAPFYVDMVASQAIWDARRTVNPLMVPLSSLPFGHGKPVVFLNIESLNALAVRKHYHHEGRLYEREFTPQFDRIAADGILYSRFIPNTIQTHRAWESTFCGIAMSIHDAYSFTPEKLPQKCLPELLVRAGHDARWYRGYQDMSFSNAAQFFPALGFSAVKSRDTFREPVAPSPWGFEECAFTDAILKDLKESYNPAKPLFLGVEFCPHHFPFSRPLPEGMFVPFPSPTSFLETYLNSLYHQDRCTGVFYDKIAEYFGGEMHFFLFADHSWPLGFGQKALFNEQGALVDNFLSKMAYVPPRSMATRRGHDVRSSVSQADFAATISHVTSGKENARSWLGSAHFDAPSAALNASCAFFSQPFDGPTVAVVRGNKRYAYNITTRELRSATIDLSLDQGETTETLLAQNLTWEKFLQDFGCPGVTEVEQNTAYAGIRTLRPKSEGR